ncbi:hypothetical protein BS47DRAFT_1397824 [Hydnum rufescens UP504]|uniref:Uncharacterized protein n=1 Tax=Hydnum rufescens UP504 TaxID=1448309 RepID=A0A9P6DMY9_9AGAM|nr:hypothetical protein BS47DRAFT_1397824 [Hydnum rufescens UP504]
MAEILAKPVIGQMAPMGTGGFDIVLDMLKDVIVDHHLLVQNMLAAHAGYGVATPGGLIPYDSSSPMYDEVFKGDAVVFSLLAQSDEDDPAGFASYLLGFAPVPGESLVYPTLHACFIWQTCNFTFSHSALRNLAFLQSILWHRNIANITNAQSGVSGEFSLHPHFSDLPPTVQPSVLSFSPTSQRYLPTSPSFSPTSPRYSPTSPSFSPASPRYSPTSPAQGSPMPPKYKSRPLRITQWILPHHYVEQICSPSRHACSCSMPKWWSRKNTYALENAGESKVSHPCSSSSVITACTQSMKDINARSSLLILPPAFPLPPTHRSMWTVAPHACSYSDLTSFIKPKSKNSLIKTFEINALSAQMLSTFPLDIRVGSDIIVWDEWQESFSTREYKATFSGSSGMFRAIDEDEVEGLIIGGSAPSSTPKSNQSKKMSIPENMSFSSPEVHSTPKQHQHSKKHFSLPSLNLRKGQMWKDEITLALEELGILTTEGDDGWPKTVYGGETPLGPMANSPAQDSSTPGALSSGRRVPISLDLPPIVTHSEASGSIQKLVTENTDTQAVTSLTSGFIVPHPDGTPLAVAVPQPTTYSDPNIFHRCGR